MSNEISGLYSLKFPIKRRFLWSVFLIMVLLYFIGNLAVIPLLIATNKPIEKPWFWSVATLISTIIIALITLMANRVSLGAPLIEGILPKEDRLTWLQTGFTLTITMLLVGFPLSLLANLDANPET